MAKSGYIKDIKYNALGGVAGSTWYDLGVIPPPLENGTSFALSATWVNTGDEAFEGHITLNVTDPNALVAAVAASTGQDTSIAAGAEGSVVFTAFALSVDGVYAGSFQLTEHGAVVVYDTEATQIAAVSTTAVTTGIDLSEMMNLMITMMIVMMMMKMMMGMMKG